MNIKDLRINRRNFLYGSGIALALPWMETFAAKNNPTNTTPKRFMAVYHPDGVGLPLKQDPAWKDWSWFPEYGKTERDFRLTKVLDVLEPLRNDICIYSGLSNPAVRKIHGHSNADQFLTGAATGEASYKNSISLDQAIAEVNGAQTRHASLVMCTNGGTGAPRGTYTISFNKTGRPVPGLNQPKQIFDMLFKVSGKDAAAKLARSKSALDLLIANAKSLNNKLSKHDKETLQQYLDSVRDTEIKLVKAQEWINTPVPNINADHLKLDSDPANDPRSYIQSIYGLSYLAFLSDTTRISTFNYGRENSGGIHDLLSNAVGLKNAHGLTHDVKKPKGWENLGTYNRFQAEEFGRFIQKLKDTPEPNGNGNMLDNTLAMHGSASSSFHLSRNYPIISAGGKNLGFDNGRYLKFGTGNEDNQAGAGIDTDSGWRSEATHTEEPLQHLYVTILQRFGVETDEFAGYKGGLKRV